MEASESMAPNGAVEVIASKILRLPEIPLRLTKSWWLLQFNHEEPLIQ
jgi:hypothetical protein